MRNFEGIVFIGTRTHTEIFKSALVCLEVHLVEGRPETAFLC